MSVLHVEGKPDEVLALCLGFSRKQVRSHGPKGEVCNYLKKTKSMFGLMDEDPTSAQPDYLKKLKINESESKYNLRVLIDEKLNHKIVLVCPQLEDWIVAMGKHCQIPLGDHYLPTDSKQLHKKINGQLEHFKKLIEHALSINCAPILHLQRILNS
jgi:hypothetical protein